MYLLAPALDLEVLDLPPHPAVLFVLIIHNLDVGLPPALHDPPANDVPLRPNLRPIEYGLYGYLIIPIIILWQKPIKELFIDVGQDQSIAEVGTDFGQERLALSLNVRVIHQLQDFRGQGFVFGLLWGQENRLVAELREVAAGGWGGVFRWGNELGRWRKGWGLDRWDNQDHPIFAMLLIEGPGGYFSS